MDRHGLPPPAVGTAYPPRKSLYDAGIQWQPIGWIVIAGGGALAFTNPGGTERFETWLAALPALTFFAGYTIFYWRLPTWQMVDILSIGSYIGYAVITLRRS